MENSIRKAFSAPPKPSVQSLSIRTERTAHGRLTVILGVVVNGAALVTSAQLIRHDDDLVVIRYTRIVECRCGRRDAATIGGGIY